MVKLRLASLLAAYALLICHIHSTHAAPARTSSESMSDQVTLTDYEARRLLSAIVKEFMQMTSEEREQQASEGNSPDRPMSKRCTNLSTCVLGKISQDIHKLQTYPRTTVGAGTPDKNMTVVKRACNTATCVTHRLADFLSRSGGIGNSNFVPTYVGAKAFGRRRRYSLM